MEHLKTVFAILLAVQVISGCRATDTYYVEDIDDPGYEVFSRSYGWQVNNFFRCAEMTEFFMEYQDIREDREASEQLADRYFGELWDKLYYEKVTVDMIGTLHMETDCTFSFDPYEIPYWKDAGFRMESAMADWSISIGCDSETFTAEALMKVEGSDVYMDSFRSVYREPGTDHVMEVTYDETSGPMSLPVCDEGLFTYVPESGTMSVKITGPEVTDSFLIIFDSDRTGVSRNGAPVKYYPSPRPQFAGFSRFR